MIYFTPYEPAHAFALDAQEPQRAHLAHKDAPLLAHALAQFAAQTIWDVSDRKIVGCVGVARIAEDTGLAWALFSPRIATHAKSVIRFVRAALDAFPARRIEAHIYPDHPKAAPFARALGFEFEREIEGGVAIYARSGA